MKGRYVDRVNKLRMKTAELEEYLPTRTTAIEQTVRHPRLENPHPSTISISILNYPRQE